MSKIDDLPQKQKLLLTIITTEILETSPDFDENSDLFEAGLDSMAIMQLIIQIEEHFGVQIPASKLTKGNFSTIKDLAQII